MSILGTIPGSLVIPLLVFVGLATGALSVVTSGGAGLVTIFLLSTYAGLSTQVSIGTVVVASVVIVGIGAREFYGRGAVDKQLSVTVGLSGVLGAYLSALVALAIQTDILRRGLGGFTLLLAAYGVYDLLRTRRSRMRQGIGHEAEELDNSTRSHRYAGWSPRALAVQLTFGFATGVATGLFGVGGGALTLAAFLFLFNLPARTVLGTSLVVSLLRYLSASFPYVISGAFSYGYFGLLAISGAVGSLAGARILSRGRGNDTYIRLILLALFLFIAFEFLT